jgi:hypothetical protein
MKRESMAKHFGIVFFAAVLLYLVSFYGIEHLRTRKGGWQVSFRTDTAGIPRLIIAQPRLGISNVTLEFPDQRLGQSNVGSSIVFDQPITNVPFGRVVYLDTTFLPGSIVFELFGHQIQLLPRVLMVDRKEMPWRSGMTLRP